MSVAASENSLVAVKNIERVAAQGAQCDVGVSVDGELIDHPLVPVTSGQIHAFQIVKIKRIILCYERVIAVIGVQYA